MTGRRERCLLRTRQNVVAEVYDIISMHDLLATNKNPHARTEVSLNLSKKLKLFSFKFCVTELAMEQGFCVRGLLGVRDVGVRPRRHGPKETVCCRCDFSGREGLKVLPSTFLYFSGLICFRCWK